MFPFHSEYEKATKKRLSLIRSEPISVPEFQVDFDAQDWFQGQNNDNVDGDQQVLDTFMNNDEIFGEVEVKPKPKISAKDEKAVQPVDDHLQKCVKTHQKIKGNSLLHFSY